ncbi:cysteine desulfurase, partial [Candidatus Peregrinibacteria bacterium]|nr:cysteine desulfurase [Candidatus Peregrinibacteria bacterium]
MKKIYLDNGASTMVDPKVCKVMEPYFEDCYGNASSSHECGVDAHRALLLARESVARSIGAREEGIVFTSGGTESNNMALKGLFWKEVEKGSGRNHIVTTKIEHACIVNTCKWLETQGCKVTYLDVDEEGFVSAEELKSVIRPETFVVSIIHGNNEIGTVQDLDVLGKVCREAGVLFHTDACQSFTKVPINVRRLPVDLMTLNSHKIHGPKGVGALWLRKGVEITPLIHGGG